MQIRGQRHLGLGHVTYFLNFRTPSISETAEATNFKFGVQINYKEYCRKMRK